MSGRAIAAFVLLALVLSGCGKPVPAEKASLLITQDGSVEYKRRRGGSTTSISAGLRGFEGDNFVVGIPMLSTTFVVSRPPYQDGDRWKMVVDGVELTRTR